MRSITEQNRDDHSYNYLQNHVSFKELEVFSDSRKTQRSESYRIIEKNLHRLINLRALNKLKNSVNHACENTSSRAENICVKHKREHAGKSYRAAHRKGEELNVRKRERKSNANARIREVFSLRSRSFVFAEKESESEYR